MKPTNKNITPEKPGRKQTPEYYMQQNLANVKSECCILIDGSSHMDNLVALPLKHKTKFLSNFFPTMKNNVMHALLIADEKSDLNWIDNPLVATGFSFNLVKAYSISEALELMTAIRFDIVMYDVDFSQEDMSEHLTSISRVKTKTPLVVLTNHLGDPMARKALNAGANYHLVKDHHNLGLMVESLKTFLSHSEFNYN